MDTPESRLAAGVAKLGIALAPAQLEALATLAAELAHWNTRVNLTAITAPDEVVDKHLLDSLAVLPLLKGLAVADVGSGAGFPGLPLAIADPDRRFTLIESTGKKVKFIRHAVERLALPNVEVVPARAESYRPARPFDAVVARALGPLAEFVQVAGHLAGRERATVCHERQGSGGGAQDPSTGVEGCGRPPCRRPRTRCRALCRRTC